MEKETDWLMLVCFKSSLGKLCSSAALAWSVYFSFDEQKTINQRGASSYQFSGVYKWHRNISSGCRGLLERLCVFSKLIPCVGSLGTEKKMTAFPNKWVRNQMFLVKERSFCEEQWKNLSETWLFILACHNLHEAWISCHFPIRCKFLSKNQFLKYFIILVSISTYKYVSNN